MPAALKGACISGHILNHYVAVDVGKKDVVGSHLKEGGVSAGGFHPRSHLVPAAVAPGRIGRHRVDVHGVAIGYIKKGSASHVRNLLNSPDYKNATCEIVGGKYKVLCEGENDDGDDVTYVDKDDLPTFAVVTTYVATQDSEPEKAQGVPVSPVSPAPSYYAPAPDLQPSPVPSSGSGKPAKRRGRGFLLFFAIFFLLGSFVSFGSGNSGPGVFYIIVSVVLFVLYFRGRRK